MAFHLRFCIEVEFLLTLPTARKSRNLGLFAECVRALYQGRKKVSWPSMHNGVGGSYDDDNSAIEWTLAYDVSIRPEGKLWDCIEPPCTVWTNDSCGTHVHVSPNDNYTLAQAKAVARAVLYFEPAINALVPPHRLNNMWCKTFFPNNANFQGKEVAQAIARVDRVGSLEDIFRQAEGVTTSLDALAWAEFVVTFIGAALAVADVSNPPNYFDDFERDVG
ncbi:hypothetical protein BDM02DRAFT_3114591, partial [Thelephora ganbajun]